MRSESATDGGAGLLSYELGAWIPVAVCAAVLGIVLAQILAFNDGLLVYALDDSYIGYALAEEIARGNYGINPGEASSPASTLAWPFLLAPLIGLPGGIWFPLLINVACVLLAVYAVYTSLARTLRDVGLERWRTLATFGSVGSIALLNLTLVTFSGMEHGTQILLAVVVAAGLVELARRPERGPVPLLVAGLVLGPLFRFEALAATVPALVLLWLHGHRRVAAGVAVAVAVPIAAFIAYLTGLGVGPLPSSLMVRSAHMFDAELGGPIVANLTVNLENREGLMMAPLAALLAFVPLDRGRPPLERRLGAWLLALVALHYCFGQFGYWGRYEPYVWATLLVVVPYLMRGRLVRWIARVGVLAPLVLAGGLLLLLSWRYIDYALRTPLASNDIYIEHYQMHRLATEFLQGPVAVNDVGYVAFGNDGYVLDLYGLTSHEIRERRERSLDPAWMAEVVGEHDIDLAMLYPQWFPRIPSSWTPVGRIRIERMKALLQHRVVVLIATREEAIPELRARLARLAADMPQGSVLELVDPS